MRMPGELRKLNEEGLHRFSEWLADGAAGAVPVGLLSDPQTSEPLPVAIFPEQRNFADRFEFGTYLNQLLAPFDATMISQNQGLWSALAIFWFDQLCPANDEGQRKPKEDYSYILSRDYRKYYRHLVRSPWFFVREHGDNCKFILLASSQTNSPLQVSGEILENFAGTSQALLRNRTLIAEANRLYSDPQTGRPRKGTAGKGGGSARRLAQILKQFELTYDAESMLEGKLLKLLPKEFDRWNVHVQQQNAA